MGLFWVIWRALGLRREPEVLLRVAGTAVAIGLVGFLAMATLFGNDLYRMYRTMNADVVTVAALAGLGWSLACRRSGDAAAGAEARQPIDQPPDLGPTGGDEFQRPGT
jgi:hypothetical protein